MAAFAREMRDVDRCDRIVGDDPEGGAGRGRPQSRFHLDDGERTAQAARVNPIKGVSGHRRFMRRRRAKKKPRR